MGLRNFLKLFGWIMSAIVLSQCAQPGTPGGGPRDTKPPEVLGSSPLNGSPNFTGDKFVIYFDEFVELDEISQKAMISPPVKKMPDFKLKGKSLYVKFNSELKENTTYTIYFGDAIVDITERNPLLNYTYIFSTGATVDSMSLRGEVINAFNLVAAEDIFVMLYKDDNDTVIFDSLPLTVPPFYLSKTDVNGHFQLNGLANTEYLMFAISDLNGNYFYDQPGEEIAFLDSIIVPEYFTEPVIDSVLLDSLERLDGTALYDSLLNFIDAMYNDSLVAYQNQLDYYTLYLFKELDTNQILLKAKLIRKNTLRFTFSRPMKDIVIQPVNYSNDTAWYIEEYSKKRDTLTWYIKNLPIDTLETVIFYRGDTLSHEFLKLDIKKKFPGIDRKKKNEEVKKEYIGIKSNISRGNIKLNGKIEISFDYPVEPIYTDSVLFVIGDDSTYNPAYYFTDSIHRKITFPFTPAESTRYSITIPDSAFINWNGVFNKLTTIRFGSLSLRDYGVLRLDLKPEIQQSYVIQLMTEKEILLQEFYFKNDTTIVLEHLDPGKYLFKLIYDDNGNRKWDTGNYTENIQPEKVTYYPKELVVRGNWEIEEEWVIKK